MGYIDVTKDGEIVPIKSGDPSIVGRSITDYIKARMEDKGSKESAKLAGLGIGDTYAKDKPELIKEVAAVMLAQRGVPDKMIERLIEGIDATKLTKDGDEIPDHPTRLRYIQYLNQFLGFETKAVETPKGPAILGTDTLKKKLESIDSYEELLGLASSDKFEIGEVVE